MADEEVEAYVLSGAAMSELLQQHPQTILINIARLLAQQLRETSEDVREGSRNVPAPQRFASGLPWPRSASLFRPLGFE